MFIYIQFHNYIYLYTYNKTNTYNTQIKINSLGTDSRKIINEYMEEINKLNNKLKNYENAIEIERAGGDITTSRAFFDLQNENKDLIVKMRNSEAENNAQRDEIARLKDEIAKLKASEEDLKKQNENQMSINKYVI